MPPIANETWKSFTRSSLRRRILLLLASLGEAYQGQLARMLGLPHNRVRALLHGGPGYSEHLSLVALELARVRPTPRGRAYEITSKGLRKARSIAAARRHRHAPGEWKKERMEGSRAPESAPSAARSTASAGWSFIRDEGAGPAGSSPDPGSD